MSVSDQLDALLAFLLLLVSCVSISFRSLSPSSFATFVSLIFFFFCPLCLFVLCMSAFFFVLFDYCESFAALASISCSQSQLKLVF